ncbi:hypothetical protein K438DRAFT_1789118 [Mycena galopus ATCC 62051]|nr:hypothetical protein K438DRAFT_1789118 [Mycena galopus ATCC 62051]
MAAVAGSLRLPPCRSAAALPFALAGSFGDASDAIPQVRRGGHAPVPPHVFVVDPLGSTPPPTSTTAPLVIAVGRGRSHQTMLHPLAQEPWRTDGCAAMSDRLRACWTKISADAQNLDKIRLSKSGLTNAGVSQVTHGAVNYVPVLAQGFMELRPDLAAFDLAVVLYEGTQ